MPEHELDTPADMRPALDRLREELDGERSQVDPSSVALTAVRKTAYRKAMVRYGIPGVAAAVSLFLFLAATVIVPEVKRFIAPPPPVVVRTFDVHCLEPRQVAELLRPYMPRPENPRWQAEAFDVFAAPQGVNAVTVRAPVELIRRVPSLIEDFESRFGASCKKP
ncbi:MAG TPA: hypothetical protein VM099_10340 [Gemmatimonadaceae bacterium]|nr:hypothetical protein [Gemmatimonadaceae bacterium]